MALRGPSLAVRYLGGKAGSGIRGYEMRVSFTPSLVGPLLLGVLLVLGVAVWVGHNRQQTALAVVTAALDSANATLYREMQANQQLLARIAQQARQDSATARQQVSRAHWADSVAQGASGRVLILPDTTVPALQQQVVQQQRVIQQQAIAYDTLRIAWAATQRLLYSVTQQRDTLLQHLQRLTALATASAQAGQAVARVAKGSWWSRLPFHSGVGVTLGLDATGRPALVAGISALVAL